MLSLLVACTEPRVAEREVHVADTAPTDRPISTKSEEDTQKFQGLIAPYIAKAKETYPDAKRRFIQAFLMANRSL